MSDQDPFASIATPIQSDPFASIAVPVSSAPEKPDSGVISGVVRGAKNLYHMPGQMWDAFTKPPETDDEKAIHANGVPTPTGHISGSIALPVFRLIVKPMMDAEDKGNQYEKLAATEKDPDIKKQLLDAAGAWKMGAKVPMVGPVAANLAERASYGEQGPSQKGDGGSSGWGNKNADTTGALAEGTTYALAPKAAEDIAKVGLKTGIAGVKGIPTAIESGAKVADAVRDITPKRAAQIVGAGTGAGLGHGNLSIPGAYYGAKGAGAMVESILGKERANAPIVSRPPPVNAGGALPSDPTPELLQSSALAEPGHTVPDPAQGLAGIPAAAQPKALPEAFNPPTPKAPPVPGTVDAPFEDTAQLRDPIDVLRDNFANEYPEKVNYTPPRPSLERVFKSFGEVPPKIAMQAINELGAKASLTDLTAKANDIARLSELLNKGLGGKPLTPGVPIKNQGAIVTPKAAPEAIPEGHTPVESSVLKSYKYDPRAKELEVMTGPDRGYVYGDVDPARAEAFTNGEFKGMKPTDKPSFGKAWNEFRNAPGNVQVAKIVNGKRVSTVPVISDADMIPEDEWEAGHALETEVEGTRKR